MSICPRCGATIQADALPEGLCPQCLLKLGLLAGAAEPAETEPALSGPEGKPAEQFGPYKTIRVLGEGGMGIVYLAEQREPIRREVALKVIKLGMNTREVMARFGAERQALALMDHPNIARVFDAGVSEQGQPYFAMEYVSGIPITDYCDKHRLTNRERMELFLPVCQAVQHAHQKGVIHRDIKPSNVMVGERDGKPFPQVIDFGIAKATDQRLAEYSAFTHFGQLVGTPEYMSPEQAELGGLNVDTATDVYSLGVLLYQLLVGVLPFEGMYRREAGLVELLRIIREEEPPTPSNRLAGLEEMAEVAANRRTDPAAMRRQLASDLSWIVLKAIEKDKERRYASASDLAGDIQRYLADQPVVARPPSASYHLQKFARRHRGLVASIAAVLVALVAGVVASSWEATRARRSEAAALSDLGRAERAEQAERQQRDRALIAERSANAGEQNAIAAKNQAIIEKNRGWSAEENAIQGMRRAVSAEEAAIQARDWESFARERAESGLAAAAALDEFIQSILRAEGPNPDDQLDTDPIPSAKLKMVLDRIAKTYRWNFLDPLARATFEQSMGKAYRNSGLYAEAQQHLETALQIRKSALDEEASGTPEYIRNSLRDEIAPLVVVTLSDLASVFAAQGELTQAEPPAAEALAMQQHIRGAETYTTLKLMNRLGLICAGEGKLPQAEAFYSQALEIGRWSSAPSSYMIDLPMQNLATLYEQQGRYAEAEPLRIRILEVRRSSQPRDTLPEAKAMVSLGALRILQQRYAEAETLLRAALRMYEKERSLNKWVQYDAECSLGESLAGQKKYAEAEQHLLASYEGLQTYAATHPIAQLYDQPWITRGDKIRPQNIGSVLIHLYRDWGKPDKAAQWQQKLSDEAAAPVPKP
jgi:serine/threonine protein kinase